MLHRDLSKSDVLGSEEHSWHLVAAGQASGDDLIYTSEFNIDLDSQVRSASLLCLNPAKKGLP